jgi:hypothetical protein
MGGSKKWCWFLYFNYTFEEHQIEEHITNFSLILTALSTLVRNKEFQKTLYIKMYSFFRKDRQRGKEGVFFFFFLNFLT